MFPPAISPTILNCRRELTRAGYFFDEVQFLITGGWGPLRYNSNFLCLEYEGIDNVRVVSPTILQRKAELVRTTILVFDEGVHGEAGLQF